MNSELLLFSEHPEDLEFAKAVAEGAGLAFVKGGTPTTEEVASALKRGNEVLLGMEATSSLQLASLEKSQLMRLHVLVPPTDKALIAAAFESDFAQNIVFRRFTQLVEDARLYARMISSSREQGLAGLKSLIGNDIEFESVKFTETLEKAFVANVLAYQLEQLKFNEFIIPPVTNAVDELLMNAMYDAPTDSKGEQVYAKESRKTNFKLEGKQSVEMQLGAKGNLIAVTVIDQFGSVNVESVKRHLAKTYNGRQNEERSSEMGGAGLGLSLILRSGGSLRFACLPGKRTEVTVFFRRTEKLREFSRQFQFVNAVTYSPCV